MWKEPVIAHARLHYPGIFLEEVNESMKNVSHRRDSNPTPPEYNPRVLPLYQWLDIKYIRMITNEEAREMRKNAIVADLNSNLRIRVRSVRNPR
jgi:hypothetical protein